MSVETNYKLQMTIKIKMTDSSNFQFYTWVITIESSWIGLTPLPATILYFLLHILPIYSLNYSPFVKSKFLALFTKLNYSLILRYYFNGIVDILNHFSIICLVWQIFDIYFRSLATLLQYIGVTIFFYTVGI